jgi:NitT/TauT family transport system substrate-binding protein
MARMLIAAAGLVVDKDVMLDYSVSAPAQLAQMVIGGKKSIAILPEPFVTMVMKQNPSVKVVADVQRLWSEVTGAGNYPMSVLVVSDAFPLQVPLCMEAGAFSLRRFSRLGERVSCGRRCGDRGGGNHEGRNGCSRHPQLRFGFRTAQDAKADMDTYFKTLFDFSPSAIGGKLPDEAFYL